MRAIGREILQVVNLEKGLGYTLYALTRSPGSTLRNYLFHDRSKLTKPVGFLVLIVALATYLTVTFFTFQEEFQIAGMTIHATDSSPDTTHNILRFFKEYFNLLLLLILPFYALGSYWLFRKNQWNFAEHLVINAYILGYQNAIYLLFFPLLFLPGSHNIYLLATLIYHLYAYRLVFEAPGFRGLIRAFGAFLVSYLLYYLFIAIVFVGVAILF